MMYLLRDNRDLHILGRFSSLESARAYVRTLPTFLRFSTHIALMTTGKALI
jgi:hypothetical protein